MRDITFTCLSAGVMEHNANTRRFQRIPFFTEMEENEQHDLIFPPT